MKILLFIPTNATALHSMRPVFNILSTQKGVKPLFLVSDNYSKQTIPGEFNDDQWVGINNYVKTSRNRIRPSSTKKNKPHRTHRIRQYIPSAFRKKISALKNSWYLKRFLKRALQEVKHLFHEIQPHAVVLYGDRHLEYEPAILKQSEEMGIPSIILPSIFPTDIHFLSSYRGDKYLVREGFVQQYPNHCWEVGDGEWVSFYPDWMTRVLDDLNLLTENPLANGGGRSSKVLVESELARQKLLSQGVNSEKIVVTGNLDDDRINERLNKANVLTDLICQKYAIDTPIVVLALPQLYEHGHYNVNQQRSLVKKIISFFNQYNWTPLISLHPKMNKETYTKWTEDTGVIIADEDLIDLIVVANLFIAWNVSTTILKGVTAGTPILTTDWGAGTQSVVPELMKFDEDYNDCFWSVLSSLMENESKFNERQIAIQNIKSEFSLGDGKCAERIVTELLDNTSLSNQSQGNYD